MFLKNWYVVLENCMAYNTNAKYKGMTGIEYGCRKEGYALQLGNNIISSYYCSMHKMYQDLGNGSYGGVILGTGRIAPTLDDYKLSGDLITTYTYSAAVKDTIDADGHTITGTYTITNTGTADFTIGEIGLMAVLYETAKIAEQYKALLERTVLDSPVTIPAGGIGQVTYTIRLKYPTA